MAQERLLLDSDVTDQLLLDSDVTDVLLLEPETATHISDIFGSAIFAENSNAVVS